MSKERLNDWKLRKSLTLSTPASETIFDEMFHYIEEQTKREQELEQIIENQDKIIDRKEQQNKRYREAIEKAQSKSANRIGDSTMIKIYEILDEALERESE